MPCLGSLPIEPDSHSAKCMSSYELNREKFLGKVYF